MTDLREAAQQALSVLDSIGQMDMFPEQWANVEALRAALAQQDEPVAWRYWKDKFGCWEYGDTPLKFPAVPAGTKMEPLYLGPDEGG